MPKSLFRRFTKKFFIITNVVVALLFVLSCYGGLLNPRYAWPIGFLTLSSFYWLILLFIFFIFWLFIKPSLALISVITVAICMGAITNIIPLRFSNTFNKQKNNNYLRIMSWNVEHFDILEHKLHPEKKQRMLDLINNYQPDIACFEEMVGSNDATAINNIPDIIKKTNFNQHYYSFNPKLDFDNKHHFGIIIFSKYPIINKQTVSVYPHDYNSTFQYVDIVKQQDTFRVFNVHLQSLKFSADNLKFIEKPEMNSEEDVKESKKLIYKLKIGFLKRKAQSERIKEEIDKSPYSVIICGDFNDVPNSYAYNIIGKNLKNAFEEKGHGLGRTYSNISPTLRIDNIFVSPKFKVIQFVRINKKLSDHYPIIADVELEDFKK